MRVEYAKLSVKLQKCDSTSARWSENMKVGVKSSEV